MFLKIQKNIKVNLKIKNNTGITKSNNHLHKKKKTRCKSKLIKTHHHLPKPQHNLVTSILPLDINATNKVLIVKDKQLHHLTIDYPLKKRE